ncbi:MAG: site-2 protease family protein [Desulfobacterota bacterium]|nr:site-2 protease family protein [Thermodesulfobacteriota bacterium]
MGLLKLLMNDPVSFLILFIPLLYSVVLHEVAHGWVANRLGDPTARWMGRLSLNPLRHLDPIGTLMLFLAGFGWAKPVPVNLNNIPNRRKGLLLVSSAGILANILLAFGALLVHRLLGLPPYGTAAVIAYTLASINITLAALNLIPIPPLDGSKILMGIAPPEIRRLLLRIEPYGFFMIVGLLLLGLLHPFLNLFKTLLIILIKLLLP